MSTIALFCYPSCVQRPRWRGFLETIYEKFCTEIKIWLRYKMTKKYCQKFQPSVVVVVAFINFRVVVQYYREYFILQDKVPALNTLCLKKVPTFKLSATLSNLNRFSKFLHCWQAYEICYKIHMTLPTFVLCALMQHICLIINWILCRVLYSVWTWY